MTHELKTWPGPFAALRNGTKTYEIRKADRPFAVGDLLWLREWSPFPVTGGGDYTGRDLYRRISYLTQPGEWGLPEGLCVLALALESAPPPKCACTHEAGDSPCPVHGMEEVEEPKAPPVPPPPFRKLTRKPAPPPAPSEECADCKAIERFKMTYPSLLAWCSLHGAPPGGTGRATKGEESKPTCHDCGGEDVFCDKCDDNGCGTGRATRGEGKP